MSAAFDRRLTPARADLAAAHLCGTIEAPRYVEGARHAVTAAAVPLRREPRSDRPIDTELLHGEVFTVYDRDAEGWAWGQAEADGYVGWLPASALGPADSAEPSHRVTALRTFVYPAPAVRQPPLFALSFGARVAVVAEEGDFARTPTGFVWRGHLAPPGPVADDPVAVAERFLGVPYLWGGRTSLGLDCSALVQTALRACGHAAPRDSDMQERALGHPIDSGGPLLRGDLVFWRGHVGLMCDATRLLHANGHTMTVAVENLVAARARIVEGGGGLVTSARRLAASPAGQGNARPWEPR